MVSANARFGIVAICLTGAALLIQTRVRKDILPPGRQLSSVPLQFGNWAGRDIPFAPQTLASLATGEFLQRRYEEQSTLEPYIDLYLGHSPRWQRHALEYHLPIDCILGSGWSLDDSGTTTVSVPGHPRILANRYLITKGPDRQLVLFWFWVHGRGVASETWANMYLTFDYLLSNRNDFALVRINTPLGATEKVSDAERRLLSFASEATPVLNDYISD